MSSPDNAIVNPCVPSLSFSETLKNALPFALVAWSIYEYAITVDHEFKVLRQRRWSISSAMFIVIRYVLMASAIVQLVSIRASEFLTNMASCNDVASGIVDSTELGTRGFFATCVMEFIINTMQYMISAVFSAMRVYAITDHAIPPAILIMLLNAGQIAMNVHLFAYKPTMFGQILMQPSACTVAYVDAVSTAAQANPSIIAANVGTLSVRSVTMTVRCLVAVGDLLILILTWKKTFMSWMRAKGFGIRTPITTLLLRDGTVYFIALIVIIVVQLVHDFKSYVYPVTFATGFNLSFIVPTTSCILISRFLTNLREIPVQPSDTTNTEYDSRLSVRFRIIGNLGEDLGYRSADEIDYAEETFDHMAS